MSLPHRQPSRTVPPPAPFPLPAVSHLRLRFTLVAEEPARLPEYKGSMLRGAFGHALRRTVCSMGPKQPCVSCSLRGPCVYTRIFETFIEGEPPPFSKGLTMAPRPYVFEPDPADLDRRDYAAGDELRFDLVLLGQAVELEAFAVVAVERLARHGLGRSRHAFRLARHERPAAPALPDLQDPSALTLRFLTPTRFQNHRGLMDRFTFRELTFRAVRRVLELAHFHVPGSAPDWHFRPLLDQADRVEITRRDLRWTDWSRWSNRQRRSITLGGVVGEMEVQGDLGPFVELLRAVEVVHVGKGATVGLGRVGVEGD